MSVLKNLIKWEARAAAKATTDSYLIDLEVKRIRALFDSLKQHGFNDDQAVNILSGICAKTRIL